MSRWRWARCTPGLIHDMGGSIVRKVIEDCGRAEAALTQAREALEYAYEPNRVAEAAMISDALTTIDAALAATQPKP